ncbi:MAG: hypothetical protein LBK04_01010 [Clostridiales Family XIII bacterium]|jgi:beta-mannosidase|nr:hypothetical protein [Clostridiales Family XIII bacterium]
MIHCDLSGKWTLQDLKTGEKYPGVLPGCNYLDLIGCGAIHDPFWGDNEKEARKIADRDFSYSRSFDLGEEMLRCGRISLLASGVDVFAEISVNGEPVAKCGNAHRAYEIDIKEAVRAGSNEIDIVFRSPLPYIHRMKKEHPVFSMSFGETPAYVRKPHCHFGWDWGPVLPPAGIHGSIEILGQSEAAYRQVKVSQHHSGGRVSLQIDTEIERIGDNEPAPGHGIEHMCGSGSAPEHEIERIFDNKPTPGHEVEHMGGSVHAPEKEIERIGDSSPAQGYRIEHMCGNGPALWQRICVYAPDGGELYRNERTVSETVCRTEIPIQNAELWWCNGLGGQPLYRVEAELFIMRDEAPSDEWKLDEWKRDIGLRTIELDTSPDKYGNTFRFIINGVPIFAKGADWVPPDSFVTRARREDLDFYIRSAAAANMNMLRVWGGGYYGSDGFYELCDRYGILVWQDCAFACSEYPLDDEAFLSSIEQEIYDNVSRIRHHASLALWCGNNEVEAFYRFMKKPSRATHRNFFFETLRNWVEENDSATPYWPGSPSSGNPDESAMLIGKGDNHLWQVWHGMKPIEHYSKLPARFCSEFGLEAMPGMKAIRSFTDSENLSIKDPAVKCHQKSVAGNEKMQFYILSKYRSPGTFDDFIYLSQLIQAESIRMATEGWRRRIGQCNGALFWQYNDCWPTASWSGIDYLKQFKALQYKARHFNSPVCISFDFKKHAVDVYGINDGASPVKGTLLLRLVGFDGKELYAVSVPVYVATVESKILASLDIDERLNGFPRKEAALIAQLNDENGEAVFRQTALLVPDKLAALPKPAIKTDLHIDGGEATLTLSSDVYTRHVYIEAEGADGPLSDNFFDLEAGQAYRVRFPVSENADAESLKESLQIKTLAGISARGTAAGDSLRRFMFRLKPWNFLTWLLYKFV